MNSTRLSVLLLSMALVAGVAGNYLFRARPGVNVFLWVALVGLSAIWAARHGDIALQGEGRWLILPTLFLAAAYAWRNSALLLVVNSGALGFTIALAGLRARKGRLRARSIANYFLGTVTGVLNILFGPVGLLFADISWQDVPRTGWLRLIASVGRGLLLAIPLLLLFGTLLSSADIVFQQFLSGLFDFDVATLFGHFALVSLFGWLAAGTLRTVTRATEPSWSQLEKSVSSISLGTVEVATILGSLDVLFVTFVIVQAHYLFGGGALIAATVGLTHAEYARRGFFELVTVAALVLPLLLFTHWLLRDADQKAQRWFRSLGGAQVGLVFVIMASAVHRMRLYQMEFGQTELRFYVTVFMIWLAAIFVWFVATVLRGYRKRFIFGAMIMGYVALLALHAMNPVAVIARTNLLRLADTGRYDVEYNLSLGSDAVPVLIEAIPDLPADQAALLAQELIRRWSEPDKGDWREWNLGRWRAQKAVELNRELLEREAYGAAIRQDHPTAEVLGHGVP